LSALASLAEYAATHSVDSALREKFALHVADGCVALQAGRRTREGRDLAEFLGGEPAAANAALIRHTEIDDIDRVSGVTACAIALPAALEGGPIARRLVDALAVGYELAARRAEALGGPRLLVQGIWPSYVAAPFGAAAAAGRMLGLSPEQMGNALALALAQTAHRVGRSGGRWLLFAQAVRAGCLAARAAAQGYTGDRGLYADELEAAALGLGRSSIIHRVSIKPHCAAKQALAAIHGLKTLLAGGVDARDIERVDVAVPTAYAGMLDREPPTASRLASIVNARYQLALAALRPALLDDVARDPVHWSAEIEDWAARVRIFAAPDLDSHYPERWPARVTAHVRGERHEILVLDSPGDPAMAFGLSEIEDKAQRILGEGGRQTVHLALHACEDDAALARLRKEFGANP
jgi:2-methylcitrate dehydratase PrpD